MYTILLFIALLYIFLKIQKPKQKLTFDPSIHHPAAFPYLYEYAQLNHVTL